MGVLYIGNQKVTPFVYKDAGNKFGATVDTFIGDTTDGALSAPTQQTTIVFNGITSLTNKALYYAFAYKNNIISAKFPVLKDISSYGMGYAFSDCASLSSFELPNLETIGSYGMQRAFSNTSVSSVSLPKLKTVGEYGLYTAFQSTSISELTFPELTTASGTYPFYSLCSGCSSLTTVRFPKLTNLSDTTSTFYSAFSSCNALTDIYFNALTTQSFGASSVFNRMIGAGTTVTHTIHFPSNLESTISGLTGYPLFGGTSGYVVLSFDLPATE